MIQVTQPTNDIINKKLTNFAKIPKLVMDTDKFTPVQKHIIQWGNNNHLSTLKLAALLGVIQQESGPNPAKYGNNYLGLSSVKLFDTPSAYLNHVYNKFPGFKKFINLFDGKTIDQNVDQLNHRVLHSRHLGNSHKFARQFYHQLINQGHHA